MRVIHSSRSSGIPLDELLEQADHVSLHTPLTDATRHLMGAEQFKRMKPTAYFINTARGGTVDQAALTAALHEGEIAGAGPRRHRPRAAPAGRPAAAGAEPGRGPARRLGHRAHPLADGRHGGREPARRARGGRDAAPRGMTRVAAVDIGSNSTRLLIADGPRELTRESIVTGLGRGRRPHGPPRRGRPAARARRAPAVQGTDRRRARHRGHDLRGSRRHQRRRVRDPRRARTRPAHPHPERRGRGRADLRGRHLAAR